MAQFMETIFVGEPWLALIDPLLSPGGLSVLHGPLMTKWIGSKQGGDEQGVPTRDPVYTMKSWDRTSYASFQDET